MRWRVCLLLHGLCPTLGLLSAKPSTPAFWGTKNRCFRTENRMLTQYRRMIVRKIDLSWSSLPGACNRHKRSQSCSHGQSRTRPTFKQTVRIGWGWINTRLRDLGNIIRNIAISFSVPLIILISRKAKNKKKVVTCQSYVPNLYKSNAGTSEKMRKVENKLNLK